MSYLQKSKMMLTAVTILGFTASPSFAATFDAAADFSLVNNPNGVWQYGWSSSLGSAFNLLTKTDQVCSGTIDRWLISVQGNPYLNNPAVGHNNTGSTLNCGSGQHSADKLVLAPGPSGQYSIVRWIAPQAGTYSIDAVFAGLDFVGPTTTDVHVLYNGTSLFSNLINGFGNASAKSLATTLSVAANDIIDFAVGFGSNRNYGFDSTSLDATISSATPTQPESVPEATSTLSLFALGALGAGSLLKRKRQQQMLGSSLN